MTGEEEWREAAWDIFLAIEQHARVETGGYASLESARTAQKRDHMESFVLAETFKYLYAIFDGDTPKDATLLPLDRIVLNTEAHPLEIFTPDASWLAPPEGEPPAGHAPPPLGHSEE